MEKILSNEHQSMSQELNLETLNSKNIIIDVKNNKNIIPINTFDINTIIKNPSIAIIGKRGSGKSWIIRHLLYQMHLSGNIDECCIFAPTEKIYGFYSNFTEQVHHKYDSKIIEEILAIQTDRIKNKIKKQVTVVFDDCFGINKLFATDKLLRELLFNARHYEITYILSMQYPLKLCPELRSNFDYVFLMTDDICSNQKIMYDYYAGMFPTVDTFSQVYTQLTENYGSMLICNRGVKSNLFEKIFYFEANDIKDNFLIPAIEYFLDCDETLDDRKMNLLLKIANCNNEMVNFVSSNTITNDKYVEIFNKITMCNDMIVSLLKR